MIALRPAPHMRVEVRALERRRRELLAEIRTEENEVTRANLDHRLHFVEGALVQYLDREGEVQAHVLRGPFVPLHHPKRRAELEARVKEVLADLAHEAIPDALDEKIAAFRRLEALSAS